MTGGELRIFALSVLAFLVLAAAPWVFGRFGISLAISILGYAVLATAWALFSGPTRYISLASAAFFGIGAYSVATLGESAPWIVVLVVAASIGAALAALVGLATLQLSGVYFVIFTLGLSELVRQLVTWYEVKITRVLGRYVFLDITQEQIYFQLLALLAATLLIGWLIARSRVGFAMQVIGDDEVVASHVGIDTAKLKIALFAISAALAALVGAVMAPRWSYLDPTLAFNPMVSFQVVIMALLGGARRLWGALVGVVPLALLFEAVNANFPNYATILIGVAFLGSVYLLPNGVTGLLEALLARRGAKGSVP
jgi:branched-chain amino acid transport system permease protein